MNLQESELPAINSLACIHTSCRAVLKTASRAPQRPSVPQHTSICASGRPAALTADLLCVQFPPRPKGQILRAN